MSTRGASSLSPWRPRSCSVDERIGAISRVQALVAAHEHDGDHAAADQRPRWRARSTRRRRRRPRRAARSRRPRTASGSPRCRAAARRAACRAPPSSTSARARRHQEHAHRVARARGQDVVRGVADDVEARGRRRARAARPPRAAASSQRSPRTSVATRVERDRAGERAPTRPALSGNCGGSWRSAHQTTPATARTEIASPTSESRESPRRGSRGSSIPSSGARWR